MANDVSEKVFLTELAVSRFNEQYGRSIDPAGCTIFSIVPNYGEAYGYEIATITTTGMKIASAANMKPRP